MKRAGILIVLFSLFSIISQIGIVQSAVDVNNFTIEKYNINYFLDRDNEGRSTLKTDEVITANFPQSDQNHGIERAIPDSYDNHTTSLKINSVVDENNRPHNYTTYSAQGNTVLRIGDADKFVHGLVTYKISYTQRDVTKFFKDNNRDEFYWDTNGVDWRVPIKTLSINLTVSDKLSSAFSGKTSCYVGSFGSDQTCKLESDKLTFSTTAKLLSPYENVTLAIGFKPNTFKPYKHSLTSAILTFFFVWTILSIPISLVLMIWFIVRYHRKSNRLSEINTIIPEYLPPKDTSVTTASAIGRVTSRSFSAQLIDFAVRHYIRIYETRKKSLFRQANYDLEIIKDIKSLKKEEQELLTDIFDSTTVGSKLDMASLKKNYSLGVRLQDNGKKLNKSIAGEYGLRQKDDQQSHWFRRTGFIVLFIGLLTLSPMILIAAITSFICGAI